MPSLSDVVAALDARYDPSWAEDWDAVGLVCGDPGAEVRRVWFAVDPVESVVDEVLAAGAQLLVTHHPLYLGGTSSVAATTPKGRVAHRLLTGGCALYVAHTNADVANPGVNDALASTIGLRDPAPLAPADDGTLDKVVTFVPTADAEPVIDALAAAGAGAIGDYTRCGFLTEGTGTFLPGAGSHPTVGEVGRVERVTETRVEMVLDRSRRPAVVAALLAAHPYEEPAYDVIPLANPRVGGAGRRGLGRVGNLDEPTTLRDFTHQVAEQLPATQWGVRAAGDPDRPVRRVAVCGGSGGSLTATAARAGADVLLTSDLKHHATSEALADTGIGLVDAAHWATEWPWLTQAADLLVRDLDAAGTTVDISVSRRVTDPWTLHHPSHRPSHRTRTEDS